MDSRCQSRQVLCGLDAEFKLTGSIQKRFDACSSGPHISHNASMEWVMREQFWCKFGCGSSVTRDSQESSLV